MRTFILGCALLAVTACGGSTQGGADAGEPDAANDAANGDSGPVPHEAGAADAATGCTAGTITFNLAVDSSGPVYYGGSQPPWPAQRTCPGWLTIDYEDAALLLGQGDCDVSCFAGQAEDAVAQSLTWDGTYYPINTSTDPSGSNGCSTPACAAPGNYVATLCVAASLDGLGEAPPTCKTVSFVWPPSTANEVISETITPSPDGG